MYVLRLAYSNVCGDAPDLLYETAAELAAKNEEAAKLAEDAKAKMEQVQAAAIVGSPWMQFQMCLLKLSNAL